MDEAQVLFVRQVILDHGAIELQGALRALIAEHCPGFVALWRKQYANPHFGDDDEATVSEPNRRRYWIAKCRSLKTYRDFSRSR